MGDCIVCSGANYTFECSHCGESVCKKHWTPEDHDCAILTQEVIAESGVGPLYEEHEPPQPADLSDMHTPAKNTMERSGPSPDVGTDGSVVEDTVEEWGQNEDTGRGILDFQISTEALFISVKTYVKYLVGLSGLALVLIGFYNMFAPLLFNVEYFVGAHHILNPLAFENRNNPIPGSYVFIYVSDVVLVAVGSLMAWFS